jgi:hypothetical protein
MIVNSNGAGDVQINIRSKFFSATISLSNNMVPLVAAELRKTQFGANFLDGSVLPDSIQILHGSKRSRFHYPCIHSPVFKNLQNVRY